MAKQSELKTRVKTLVVLNLLIIPLVIFSFVPYLMKTAVSLLCVTAIYEIYKATQQTEKELFLSANMVIAVVYCFFDFPYYDRIQFVFLLASSIFFAVVMLKGCKFNFKTPVQAFVLSLMMPVLYSAIFNMRALDYGVYYVFLMIICSIVTEMGGYFIGRKIGKHKFAPIVSPNKSIEGALGGVLCCYILVNLIALATSEIAGFSVNWPMLQIYIFACSLFCQFGDLTMSAVKRCTGIKDFGTILPGHGGILDRFDAQLFAAPFSLIFIKFVGGIFS